MTVKGIGIKKVYPSVFTIEEHRYEYRKLMHVGMILTKYFIQTYKYVYLKYTRSYIESKFYLFKLNNIPLLWA